MEQYRYIPNLVTREVLFLGGHYIHKGAPKVVLFEDLVKVPEIPKSSTNSLKKRVNYRGLNKVQQRQYNEKNQIVTSIPFQRSVQYTLLIVVDEDKAREYYKS
jgi:hypothetical protein